MAKLNCKTKRVTNYTQDYLIMVKASINQESITFTRCSGKLNFKFHNVKTDRT